MWCDGACLADIGYVLSVRFRQLSLIEFEDAAVTIWARATLNVCAHYYHLMGPAMIALADMHKRRGDLDYAKGCYESIVMDFKSELKRIENNKLINADDMVSLKSLHEPWWNC